MTRQEAIDDAVAFAERYNLEYHLNEKSAEIIGRKLWGNLRQSRLDALQFNGRGLTDAEGERPRDPRLLRPDGDVVG